MSDWPPLKPGTRVLTVPSKDRSAIEGWVPEAQARKKFGVEGVIRHHHDSHGLYYEVEVDGELISYDPTELEALEPVMERVDE